MWLMWASLLADKCPECGAKTRKEKRSNGDKPWVK